MPQYSDGRSVLVVASGCGDACSLSSESECREFLTSLASVIGMTPLGDPHSVTLTHPIDSKKSGVSAFQFIQESHLAIHTWPEHDAVRIVVDSCREFALQDAVNFIVFVFEPAFLEVGEFSLPTYQGILPDGEITQ